MDMPKVAGVVNQEVQNAISQVNRLLGTDVTQDENVTH